MPMDISPLKAANETLKHSLSVVSNTIEYNKLSDWQKETMQAGVIQHFEICYEISWKMIKYWLETNIDPKFASSISRIEFYRRAREHSLIEDIELWMGYHNARNKTSHIYDEEIAKEVFDRACEFSQDADKLIAILEKNNA